MQENEKQVVSIAPPLDEADALAILEAPDSQLEAILAAATAIRAEHFGDKVHLCSILNAKSGACSEDCSFCAQSASHNTSLETFPLLDEQQIVEAYDEASELPIERFGVVTSGKALTDRDVERICSAMRKRPGGSVQWCASLGTLNYEQFIRLGEAGLNRFHHNLETEGSFFQNICTTHTYADRVSTIAAAVRAGLEVCAGGLFGLGESPRQRVELAFALRNLAVHAIPLNFLVPIANTPAATTRPMSPGEIIRIIAMFRLVCPTAEIKVCAGREQNLGEMEDQIFAAGATGMMIGGYLTVRGRSVEQDLEMIRKSGMHT